MPSADIAVITVASEEYAAVLAKFESRGCAFEGFVPTPTRPNLYGWRTSTLSDCRGLTFSLVVGVAIRQGQAPMSNATAETIRVFNPRTVLLVGYAGGFSLDGLGLGDVAVSKLIYFYQYGKLTEVFQPRHDQTYQVDQKMLTSAEAFAVSHPVWADSVLCLRPSRIDAKPKMRSGVLASGDMVVDQEDNPFFKAVHDSWKKLLAVEMEGGGAASAIETARSRGRTVDFIMVRGISDQPKSAADPAEGSRADGNAAQRDDWKPYASASAAAFAVEWIVHGWPTAPKRKRKKGPASADPPPLGAGAGDADQPLTADLARPDLSTYPGFQRSADGGQVDVGELLGLFAGASAKLSAWPTCLPDGRWLDRTELRALTSVVAGGKPTQTVLLGPPGSGKSALLARLVTDLKPTGVAVLAIKADLLPRGIRTAESLQAWLRLAIPVAAAILAVARNGPVVLVLDQLDALADLVDLHSERLHVLLDLVGRVAGRRNVHVVCSCREFEYAHDGRFLVLGSDETRELRLQPPSWQEIENALVAAGTTADAWPSDMRELLRTPQHLALFLRHFRGGGEQPVVTTFHQLCARVWGRDVVEPGTGRDSLLYALADKIAETEELWQDLTAFEHRRGLVDALVGCEWLALSDDDFRMGFRHQTLFEFTRAKAFAARPGALSDHTLARQDALFCRPALWSTLQYLRQVNPPRHREEFLAIWNAPTLRRHLKYLLIDHLGQIERPEPADWEQTLLLAALKDPNWRLKVLTAITGRPVWFRLLADTTIAGEMRRPSEEAWPVLWVLRAALETDDHDRAIGLMRAHWLPDDAKVGWIWSALAYQKRWTEAAGDLLIRVFRRTEIKEPWHIAEEIAKEFPATAIQLLAAWAEAAASRARVIPQEDERGKAYEALLGRMNEWVHLDRLAERDPVEFVARLWPVVVDTLGALAVRASDSGLRYASDGSWRTRLDCEEYASVDRRDWLAVATDTALTALARSRPNEFLAVAQNSLGSGSALVHRLVCRGYRALAAVRPGDALAYLLADERRFWLGGIHNGMSDTVALVATLGESVSDAELERLIDALRGWMSFRGRDVPIVADDPEEKFVRRRRLRLLSALPSRRLPALLRDELDRERASLPESASAPDGFRPVQTPCIESPVSSAEMGALSDDDLAARIAELPDATEWHHPKDWMLGGSAQLSREFEKFVSDKPDRGVALLARLQPGVQEKYAAAAVRGLVAAKLPAAEVFRVVADLDRRGFHGHDFRTEVGSAAADLAHPDGLPDDFCDLLDRWRVTDWPDNSGEVDAPDQGTRERPPSTLWGHGGGFTLPHGRFPVLQALTQGYLGRRPHAADRWLEMLTDHLDRHETATTWRAMGLFLRDLRCCSDRARAGDFLARLFETYPTVLHSVVGVRALADVEGLLSPPVRERSFAAVRGWPGGAGARAFGELIALRHLRHADDAWAAATIGAAFSGASGPDAPEILVGVAHAAANTWLEPNARAAASALLLRLFDRTETSIVWAAGTLFHRDRIFPTDDHTRALFRRLADRPEALGHLDAADGLFEHLLDLFADDPAVVCRIAEAFVQTAGETLRTMSGRAYMAAPHLIDLAIRLQRRPEPEYRARGLILFETLLDLGVNEAVQTLQENDHRLSGASRLPRRRRTVDSDDDGDE